MVCDRMFIVDGVEACTKKLDMTLGHQNPLDNVYKLSFLRKSVLGQTQLGGPPAMDYRRPGR